MMSLWYENLENPNQDNFQKREKRFQKSRFGYSM